MRKTPLVTGEIYHICNKSTEGIPIFSRAKDAQKFLQTLYEANTLGPTYREINRARLKTAKNISEQKQNIVDIYAIVLMTNHFHICVKQLEENGITLLLQRTCNSFSHYFNTKYERKGTLFMGRFKAIPVVDDRQLFRLFVYIHANPLDAIMPYWREGRITDWEKADLFLKQYRWSSFGLYVNNTETIDQIKNLVVTDFPSKFLSEWGGLKKGLHSWSSKYHENDKELFLE